MADFDSFNRPRYEPPPLPPPMPNLAAVAQEENRALLQELAEAQSAESAARNIHRRMVEFGERLDGTKEVGVALVNLGQDTTLHVDRSATPTAG
jgi:hypothetical protein